jgi:hypothetical protein
MNCFMRQPLVIHCHFVVMLLRTINFCVFSNCVGICSILFGGSKISHVGVSALCIVPLLVLNLHTCGLWLWYKMYINAVAVQLFSEDSTDFLDHLYHKCSRCGVRLMTCLRACSAFWLLAISSNYDIAIR